MKLSNAQLRVLQLMKEGYTYCIVSSATGDTLHYLQRGSEVQPLRKDTAHILIAAEYITTLDADHSLMKEYYLTEKGLAI
jgi:hypothetical protein